MNKITESVTSGWPMEESAATHLGTWEGARPTCLKLLSPESIPALGSLFKGLLGTQLFNSAKSSSHQIACGPAEQERRS